MKKALPLVCLFALCNLTLLAQTGKGSRFGHTEMSAIHVAPQDGSTGLQTIFSNLGPPSDPYIGFYWPVDSDDWVGMAFTPTADAHVTQVRVAVEHVSGPKVIYVSIYSDSGGYPGTLLEGPVVVTKMPKEGSCCDFAVANFLPLQVYGGQPYWVEVTTPLVGPGTNSVSHWHWTYQGTHPPVALDTGTGWIDEPTYQESAFEVLGTLDEGICIIDQPCTG